MTKIQLFLVFAGMMLSFSLSAQISEGGRPLAQKSDFSSESLTAQLLPELDINQIITEDDVDQKMGNYPKIGRVISTNYSLHQYADTTTLINGDVLYRIKLRSTNALGMSLLFENFSLPAGAKLFIHSPDYSQVLGAYTQVNNTENGQFSTELIASDEVIVEYFEPYKSVGLGDFTISGVLHAYRMVPGAEPQIARDFGDSDPCQVNVNCSEGNNWQNQKRGVVRILIFEGQSAGWCSGSLVNNTAQNCTPYILTALHCGENATTNNMNQWIFYFNYEASGCANPGNQNLVPNQTMTGCARIADSGDGGGNTGSDYMLVQINNSIPNNYNPYYNGWSAINTTSSSGVSIHHPSGDIKKISTYNANLVNSTWGGNPGTHWRVNWVSTTNGHGVTEGGSSGSPIFNAAGLIIGTLTGGTSFCSTPTTPDYYGKMSYHWTSNPGDDLRDYLAPGSPATTTLTGTNQPCGGGGGNECVAGAVFSTATQSVCPGETGTFNTLAPPTIPAGGGYAVLFESAGGTGGVPAFAITDVTLPFEFDNDINGVLSFNDLNPLSGAWTVSGFVYTDPANAFASLCNETSNSFTVNFLAANNPLCSGGGGNNNTCSNATAIVPGSYPFSTVNATTDGPAQPGSPCDVFGQNNVHNDIWYTYTASCNGTASFSTCNTATFDTRIAVYPGGQCPPTAGSLIGCNDDGVDCAGYTSFIQWNVVAGNTYLLRLGGYNAAAMGTGTVELIESCSGAVCLAGAVFSTATQNVCPDETGTFNTLTPPTIPAGGGYAVLFESAGGTGGVPAFAITDVTLPFEFDNDINGVLSFNDLNPLMGAWTVSGFVYTDPANAFASLCSETSNSFTVNFLAANNPLCSGGGTNNNTCSNATAIVPGSYPFSTVNATTDGPAQPGSPCDVFGQNNVHNDIWFTYTATCNGTASFSTCSTATFDTRIAVYPGGQCPPAAASLIGCNDDGVNCTGFTSFIQWNVIAGNTYLLRLGGYSPTDIGTGTVALIETCSGSDCTSTIPYPLNDPCVIQVIAEDAFCCDNTWDNLCQEAYNDCAGIEGPCLSWTQPTTTTAWENFNITYDGAPCNDGTGCPIFSFTTFEVWGSEAYVVDNVLLGGTYTFSHCTGPGAGSWVPEYTIFTPSAVVDAFGEGNGDGCSITWTATEAGSYYIVINVAGNCGVANQIDNGFPALTCDNNTMCDGVITGITDASGNEQNFMLYPNPNKGQFVIEHSGNGSLAQIDIMDVSGRMIQAAQVNFGASSRQDIDLGKQASGIYFVRITHNQESEVLRVVIH
jgi:hypothetical protein